MSVLRNEVTGRLAAPPDDVFALLVDAARLADWNAHIDHVIDAPDHLTGDAQWVVKIRANGTRWDSRSTLQTLDRTARRFAYRTQTDDGNPSYALWTWNVTARDTGSEVAVRWELHPQTFWRRMLLVRIRHRQLKKEVPASLAAADRLLAADRAAA